jgi:hypothetical protein
MFKKYIKQTQRRLEKQIKSGEKPFLIKPYLFLTSFLRPIYFNREYLMLKGLKKKSTSKYESVLFFTVHKSASTFIKNTIFSLEAKRLRPVKLGALLTPQEQDVLFNNQGKMKKIMSPRGYIYGAFRSFYSIPDIEKYTIILVLRDPRDCAYFTIFFNLI